MGTVVKLIPDQPEHEEVQGIRYCGLNRYVARCGYCYEVVWENEGDLFRDDNREKWIVIHRNKDCKAPDRKVGYNLPMLCFLGFTITVFIGLLI